MIIDSHCHIDFSEFDTDREQVLERAWQQNIQCLIVPGVKQQQWAAQLELCRHYPQLKPCLGLHPYFIQQHSPGHLQQLRQMIQQHSPLGVGECGLDYYLKELDRQTQQLYFHAQLDMAVEFDLPVVVHARKSTEDVISAIKARPGLRGMIHSFAGSYEQAQQLITLGFYLSFGGPITYPGSTRLRKLVSELPLEWLLIETDAPDQPVASARGQRNEPAFIIEVINAMAELQQIEPQQLIDATTNNAQALFQLV